MPLRTDLQASPLALPQSNAKLARLHERRYSVGADPWASPYQ